MRLRRSGRASRGPLNADVRWHLASVLPWFSFAALCFGMGYVGCAYYLRRRTSDSPLLHVLFRPRRNRPGYVLRSSYLLPPAVPPAGVADNVQIRRLYKSLRVNAYGAIAAAVLAVVVLVAHALGFGSH